MKALPAPSQRPKRRGRQRQQRQRPQAKPQQPARVAAIDFDPLWEALKSIAVCFAVAAVGVVRAKQADQSTPGARRVKKVESVSSKVVATEIEQ